MLWLEILSRRSWDLDARDDPAAAETYVRDFAKLFAISLRETDCNFYNRVDGFKFGSTLFARCDGVAQSIERTYTHINEAPADSVLIIHALAGASWRGEFDGRRIDSDMGAIRVADMARPFRVETDAFEALALILPRAALGEVGSAYMHGMVLSEQDAVGRLLGSHLRAMWESRAQLTRVQAEAGVSVAAMLLASAVPEAPRHPPAPQRSDHRAVLAAARALVEREYADPDLSPERMRAALGMSRSLLYQCFEPIGGVAKFIQNYRLDRALNALLCDKSRNTTIAQLSLAHGFRSDAHFSRLFRSRFNIPPARLRRLHFPEGNVETSALERPDGARPWLGDDVK